MTQRILFLAANPTDTSRLALDRESREIEERLRAADHRGSLEFHTRWAVRAKDLLQHLNQHRPHVVHFSGHGSNREELILEDRDGKSKAVTNAALRQLFSVLKDNIRIVVLNACYSREQARAITEVVDFGIGMNSSIGDEAAIVFAAAFYQGIAFGRSVLDAFESGKAALMLEGIPEENTVELIVRKGVDAATAFLVPPLPQVSSPKPYAQLGGMTGVEQYGYVLPRSGVNPLMANIIDLHTSGAIRRTASRVLEHDAFPRWMSVGDKLVQNPVWDAVPASRRTQLLKRHKVDGPTPPTVMHLDLMLIRLDDHRGCGRLFTYFSRDWNSPLLPYRQWLPEDRPSRRRLLNAEKLSGYLGVPKEVIRVTRLPGKFAISAKPQVEYGDLVLYIFEFCSVTFTDQSEAVLKFVRTSFGKRAKTPWLSLRDMRDSDNCWRVNGDVVRAVHELFTVTLGPLPTALMEHPKSET